MPPRSRSGVSTPEHLTAENLETLASAVSEGKRATVYLREATPSLGIEAGCSAKVVSVEGNTVVISPKGVNDELPFEAEELRMTRKAPEPVERAKPTRSAAPTPAPRKPAPRPAAPTPAPAPVASPTAAPKPPAAPQPPATAVPTAVSTPTPATAPAPASAQRRAKKPQGGVSVTIHAGPENEWTVTVTHGAKRPSKAVPVSPDAVDRAMRELGEPGALEAVQSVISAARVAAEERIAALSKELEDARRALEALGATS
ncbi:DUF6319 family protein [Rhodococcus sp. ACT016]|uniref:DUF6319 family protein n=1 Tax=Rhodococcus sp. ACT016 TaxID=3134808 RepID=UPI003D298C5D